MAKGFNMPRGGGANINQLMKQAQKMQADMLRVQEEMNEREFTATAGGGVVKATVTGGKKLVSVELQEAVVDPDDIEMLQDLIVAAVNEALRTAEETVSAEMNKFTGGMNLGFCNGSGTQSHRAACGAIFPSARHRQQVGAAAGLFCGRPA